MEYARGQYEREYRWRRKEREVSVGRMLGEERWEEKKTGRCNRKKNKKGGGKRLMGGEVME